MMTILSLVGIAPRHKNLKSILLSSTPLSRPVHRRIIIIPPHPRPMSAMDTERLKKTVFTGWNDVIGKRYFFCDSSAPPPDLPHRSTERSSEHTPKTHDEVKGEETFFPRPWWEGLGEGVNCYTFSFFHYSSLCNQAIVTLFF